MAQVVECLPSVQSLVPGKEKRKRGEKGRRDKGGGGGKEEEIRPFVGRTKMLTGSKSEKAQWPDKMTRNLLIKS
jgi:hypothetical protein